MASSPSAPTIPPPTTTTTPSEPPSQQGATTTTTTTRPVDKYNNANPMIHTVALGVTPLALLALCLPPRRLDLRATLLGGVALWGTNQLAHDYSGKSFAQRFSARMASLTGTELPQKAVETQARLREEKERRVALRALRDELAREGGGGIEGLSDEEKKRKLAELWRRRRREAESESEAGERGGAGQGQGPTVREGRGTAERGVLEKIWMGDAEADWKEKLAQREREALREGGGGYWGLIMDQIAEVWGGGKKDEGNGSKERNGDDNAGKS
ncbi:hypothetical protein F5Y14DRAFT_439404 [Nemania sp. NC0429]|nr:hypothetical protein F5Y14DRAFT_439404 [Nemania sp. NC0429]